MKCLPYPKITSCYYYYCAMQSLLRPIDP
uniref:Uncharacterized protein n=1 Tax=Arundo donax TaxID=35708 RepID=A0A0A8XPI5_ARUDO